MRSHPFTFPYLLSLGVLTAGCGNVVLDTGSGGGGTTGAGANSAGTSTGTDTASSTDTITETSSSSGQCPSWSLTGGACLVDELGFPDWAPEALELVATVTELGEGVPPLDCMKSPARLLFSMDSHVWARLEDFAQKEWVVAFDIPMLEAGFNGHVAVGDVVQVSLTFTVGPTGSTIGDLTLKRDGALVAFASENKPPAWYKKGPAICQSDEEVDSCCGITAYDAHAEVNGETATVPSEDTAVVGGLAVSNLRLLDMEDLGCCNYFEFHPIHVAAAALP